jgi:hypothetical protein
MDEPRGNGATLLEAQLRFAEKAVDAYVEAYAQGAKMYCAMWGLWASRRSTLWKR